MKISTGMAEISLGRNMETGAAGKAYIWPDYRQNAVEKIKRVDPYRQEQIYFKPDMDEKERILGRMHRVEQGYNASGRSENLKTIIAPGSFFNALA